MPKWKIWFLACRPKTLSAGVVPVMIASAMAFGDHVGHLPSLLAALFCALSIQIGTNLCNDYSDYLKGADTPERLGPLRVTQAGWVSLKQIKLVCFFVFLSAAVVGLYLVHRGGALVLLLGTLSILSGWLYTAGPFSLAYLGLGELFVIAFFGPVATLGTYYVQSLQINLQTIWVGLCTGCLSAAILAVNNLRDRAQDEKAKKRTLAVRFGEKWARGEYVLLVLFPVVLLLLMFLFSPPLGKGIDRLSQASLLGSCWILGYGVVLIRRLFAANDGPAFNKLLTQTGQLILGFGVLFSLGYAW